MYKKVLICVCVMALILFADKIFLSSGKTINGSIKSYDNFGGLTIETEFGEITVKPGNLVSFVIDDDDEFKEEDVVTYLESSIYKKGLRIDTLKLSKYRCFFDRENKDLGMKLPFWGTHEVYGVNVMIVMEELDVSLKDYIELSLKLLGQQSQYYKKGKIISKKFNNITMKLLEAEAKVKGNEIQYLIGFFKKDETLFKITTFGLPLMLKNKKELLYDLFNAMSFKEG